MAKTKFLIHFAIAAILVACTPPPKQKLTSKVDLNQINWSAKKGNSSIKGQAFFRTSGGDVRTCAGYDVFIIPKSDISDETHNKFSNSLFLDAMGRRIEIEDSHALVFMRTFRKIKTCDAQGNFSFSELPAGEWYIRSDITWNVPTGRYSSSNEGGTLSQLIKTRPNETTEVILTHRPK